MPDKPAADPNKPATPSQVSPPAPATPPAAANTPPAGTPPGAGAASGGGEPEPPDPFAEADKPFLDAIRKVDGEPQPEPASTAKPAAAAKPGAAATTKPTEGRTPAPELRKQYETTKSELETLRTQHGELQRKITEFEARGKDTETLRERLTSMEKEHGQLQAELRAFRQEQSPEFKEKYDKPFDQAAKMAKADISELEVITDSETNETRPASWKDDFAPIYRLPLAQALKQVKEKFGTEGAQVVMHHFHELKRLDRQREEALADEKEHAQERMKQEEQRNLTMRDQEKALRDRVSTELSEKIEYYRDDPADKEAMEARQKALSVYDSQPADRRLQIVKDSHIRHRVAAYPVLVLKVMRLERELATLKGGGGGGGREESNPTPKNKGGTGDGGGGSDGGQEETWDDAARKAMSQT